MIFLSIDFGTSAVKMSIVNEEGSVKSFSKAQYPYILLPGEKVEIAADALWRAFYDAADNLNSELKEQIDYVCYDTFSPSPVFLNKSGELVYPNIITHMDRRSRQQSAYIDEVVGKDDYMNISGIYPFPGGCSAMTFIWFLQNEPEVYNDTAIVGHLPTYIHKMMTGNWMVDMVNASMTGLYRTTTQEGWSEELIKIFGLNRSWFADIVNPGEHGGTLLPEVAARLGVKAGVPVAYGTNDIASAQLGARNTQAGDIMVTAGSSEMVSILTDCPVVNPHYYLRNSALPNLWQIYATTAGGFALDWFYKTLCCEMTESEFHSYLEKVIKRDDTSNEVSFDPYLTGDRQSLTKKTGSWHGLTLAATRDDMLYSMLRAIQGVLSETIHEAKSILPLSSVIKISGGMVTPAYIDFKMREIAGYTYQVVHNCPILGNVELVKHYLS